MLCLSALLARLIGCPCCCLTTQLFRSAIATQQPELLSMSMQGAIVRVNAQLSGLDNRNGMIFEISPCGMYSNVLFANGDTACVANWQLVVVWQPQQRESNG